MKKFTNDAYADIRELSDMKVSPDGAYAVYTVRTMNIEEDAFETSLWLLDIERGTEIRLTAGPHDGGALWLDSEHILFTGARGGGEEETVFYRISVHGGEALPYMTVPLAGASAFPVDEGRFLILAVWDGDEENEKRNETWMYYNEYPLHVEGQGYSSRQRSRIWLWDRNEQELLPLTDEKTDVQRPYFSEPVLIGDDGFWFAADCYEKNRTGGSGLYFCSFEEKQLRKCFDGPFYVYSLARWDGRIRIGAWTSSGPETGTMRVLSIPEKAAGAQAEGTVGNGGICSAPHTDLEPGFSYEAAFENLFVFTDCGRAKLGRWMENGSYQEIPTGGVYPASAAYAKGRLLVAGYKKNRLSEIYVCRDGVCTALTHQNDSFFATYALSEPESLKIGHTDGWVMRPVNEEPGRKYPAILNIHGGPHGYVNERFQYEQQRWCSEGYYVLFCNPRGSVSYGREFADITGAMGVKDYDDLMQFVDGVLEAYPDIDSGRLGVTGQSYGGYMTNWVIGHTDRFAAAVPRISISNWISMRGTSEERWYADTLLGADLWNDLEKVWFHSPLRYVRAVKTPTLFIQHEKDCSCPVEQAEQMFAALLEQDVPAKLLVNIGAMHGGRRVSHLLHDVDAMLEWFGRYLQERKDG